MSDEILQPILPRCDYCQTLKVRPKRTYCYRRDCTIMARAVRTGIAQKPDRLYTFTCGNCQNEFTTVDNSARFCSTDCRARVKPFGGLGFDDNGPIFSAEEHLRWNSNFEKLRATIGKVSQALAARRRSNG